MPVYHNVSATIHVDGKALDEYQIAYDGCRKLVSCWIPSRVGKEFSIHIRNNSSNDHMRCRVAMDGDFTNSQRVAPQTMQIVDRCRSSPTTVRSFVFSQSQLVDESANVASVAGVGTILIKVNTGKLETSMAKKGKLSAIKFPEAREIPEGEKTGIDTCVTLGPVKATAPQNKRKKHRKFKTTGLEAEFVFKYRSLDFLQAKGIAPPRSQAGSSNDEPGVSSGRKRKRSLNEAWPAMCASKVTHTDNRAGAIRDVLGIEINTEEGLHMLRALRSKIDQVLAEQDPQARPKKKRIVINESEIIDLT